MGGMVWIAESWAVFKAALGVKRYIIWISFASFAGVITWWLTYLSEVGVNISPGSLLPWVSAFATILIVIVLALLDYAVKLRRRMGGARIKLSHLREEGVRIRNAGNNQFADQSSWLRWQESALDWDKKIIDAIKEVNEADAIWFSVLDVVPSPRIPFYRTHDPSDPHEKLYREHDFRLKRLGAMIQNLWRAQN